MQCYQCNVKLEYDLTEIRTGYGCSECHGAWLPAKFLKQSAPSKSSITWHLSVKYKAK